MAVSSKTCVITGSSGYVGGRIKTHLQHAGWQIVDWTRQVRPATSAVHFRLGEEVNPLHFEGTRTLVHCAYDFKPRRWEDIHTINVRGSEKLFRAAHKAGVERIVFISSLSAFDGCRSLYGRAKLEIEAIAQTFGAIVIRPGLVYGDKPGGVFGGLVEQVRRERRIPLLSGGRQMQFLVHDEDLGRFVERCAAGDIRSDVGTITLAHAKGWTLRQILEHLAIAGGKRLTFIPVPWRLAWLGLKTLELASLPSPFRSDSLIGLVYPNPSPSFELANSLGANCRPFEATAAMLA